MCEMTRQPSVRRIPAACSQHPVQLGFQFSRGDAQAALADLAPFIAVAQLQSRLQQILYRSREGQRRRRGDVHHLPATIQQMGQTALMERELESVVGRPAVVKQKPVVLSAQNQYRLFTSSARQNGEYGRSPAPGSPRQPGPLGGLRWKLVGSAPFP